MSFSIKKSHKLCNQYPNAPKEQDFQVDAENLGISFTVLDLIEKDPSPQQTTQTVRTGGQAIRSGALAQMDYY